MTTHGLLFNHTMDVDRPIHQTLLNLLSLNREYANDAVETMAAYEPFRAAAADLDLPAILVGARFVNELYPDMDIDVDGDLPEHTASIDLAEAWVDFAAAHPDRTLEDVLVAVLAWCERDARTHVVITCMFQNVFHHPRFIDLFTVLIHSPRLCEDTRRQTATWLYGTLEDPFDHASRPVTEDDFGRLLALASEGDCATFTLASVDTWLTHWVHAAAADVPCLLARWSRYLRPTYEKARTPISFHEPVSRDILAYFLPRWKQDPAMSRVLRCGVARWMKPLVLYAPVKRPQAAFWDLMALETEYVRALSKALVISAYPALAARIGGIRQRRARRRLRVAFMAVWGGGALWRAYQAWSLHPDRLRVASSALAQATVDTRTRMPR